MIFYKSMKGRQIEYIRSDESSKRWINEFRTKTISVPGKLENIQGLQTFYFILLSIHENKFSSLAFKNFEQ